MNGMNLMDISLSSSNTPSATRMASGLFNSVVSMGRTAAMSAMQRFQGDFDPFLVRTVNTKDYGTVRIQDRHEGLLFYGPKKLKKEEEVYEVIVLAVKNDTAFW